MFVVWLVLILAESAAVLVFVVPIAVAICGNFGRIGARSSYFEYPRSVRRSSVCLVG